MTMPATQKADLTGQMALVARLGIWPRRLGEDLAAFYLGISKTSFRDRWKKGLYPPPIEEGGRILWDRVRLDRLVDAQSGLAASCVAEDIDTWADLS